MSDINIQTFSGKVNVANNFQVGSSHFFVDAQNNNVGIGTNNPTHTIDVHGDANVGVLTATFLHGDGSNIQNIASSQWEGSPGDPIYYGSNVGIATTSAPTRTLEVGSNLYVEDAGSNVLVVDGNVAATSITIGDATIVASQGLDHVTNENNTTTQVVQFNNPTTGFVTASNAVIGGTLSLQNFELSQSYGLENVTNVNNTTEDTIISSNATTGFQATANVAVGRDALVTGNVTVGKDLTVSEEATFSSNVTIAEDLEVSGNVTNLDVLSNVNLLSVSNVVSIRKDSNVVTEFPRSKKLIKYPRVALTQNDESGGYTASASNYSTGREPYEAFDNTIIDDNDCWTVIDTYDTGTGDYNGTEVLSSISGTPPGAWIQIQSPDKFKLMSYVIYPRDSSSYYNDQAPVDGEIWGSNDENTWERVHTYSGLVFASKATPYTINISENSKYYKYYTLIVTKNGGDSFYAVSIGQIELYGIPEYDPDADGVDVKVTSYPNVPNTDWLEVYYDAKDLTGVPSTVLDMSGNSINGTLNGGVSVSDGVFTFDGVDDYITSSTLSSHFTGDPTVTYACWAKFNAMTTNQMFFTVNAPGIYAQGVIGGLFLGTDGTLYNTVGNRGIKALEKLVTDRWYHIVATKIPGNTGLDTQKLYIDGLPVSAHIWNTSGNQVIGSNPVLRIGAAGNGNDRMNGSMANARLFNRALTSDEVWQLYAYQKEYFGHGDLSMTLKAGRLGIGTSEPRADLDVKGVISFTENSFDIRYASDASWPASAGYPIGSYSGDSIESQFMWRTLGSSGGEYFLYHVPRNGILMLNVTMIHRLMQFRSGQSTHAVYWNLRKSTDNGATWNLLTSKMIGHRWINTTSWDQEWHPVTIPFTGRVNEGDQVALFVFVEFSGTGSSATGNFQVFDARMRGILI
jgi:cytoskeletal protein CcmA (bactofilin family)